MAKRIYCFSANEAGIHGTGTAKIAYEKHGARWGKSYGHFCDSFAIPTRDHVLEPLPLDRIEDYVRGFLAYARGHHNLTFQVTRLDSVYPEEAIARLFTGAPNNCTFDRAWYPILGIASPIGEPTNMAQFYGTVRGDRGETHCVGHKSSGLHVTAQSFQGVIDVRLDHDPKTGLDMVIITRLPHNRDYASQNEVVLYEGPVNCADVNSVSMVSSLDMLNAVLTLSATPEKAT